MLQRLRIDFEQDRRQGEVVLLLPARVELSDPPDRLAVQDHASGAPRVQRGVRGGFIAGWSAAQQRLQIAFDVEEIDRALSCAPLLLDRGAERRCRDADRLANPGHIQLPLRCARLPQVNTSNLEYPNAGSAPVQVIADVLDQPA